MSSHEHIVYLVKGALEQTASPLELQELLTLIKQDESGAVSSQVEALLKAYESPDRTPLSSTDIEAMAAVVLQADKAVIIETVKQRSIAWKRWVAAASILLLLGAASYFTFFNKPSRETAIAKATTNDVNPGGYKARLTLADGTVIVLDSIAAGELTKQGGTIVINKDGKLVYSPEPGVRRQEVLYNTLSTARGETYATVLADGSKVWLNSASSIRYPVSFNENERRVEITGEAYFEVAKDPTKKFIVSGNGVTTEVLGTHFNINTYSDEGSTKVTLLEGSVKVSLANLAIKITPGQQAQVTNEINVVNGVNTDEVMAWKNDLFSFNKADIKTVMRQLARWYDVDVQFDGPVPTQLFGGEIQRDILLSKVLENLEKNGVHFKIEGKKIIVSK